MSSAMLRQVEQNIQQQKKFIEMGESLERLKSNRDFKRLILDGYFEQEAIRLVHYKSSPSAQKEEIQKSIESQMFAIGSLGQYFNTIRQQCDIARKQLESDEATREELLLEGAGE